MDAVEKLTKRGRTGKNFYRIKALRNACAARARTLSMKTQNPGFFSKKDITHFINTYFSEKTPVPYSRLSILNKILVCQCLLHNQPDATANAHPFVFRLSPELNAMSDSYLRKAIQRKLKDIFGTTPLYWLTTEYDNQKEQYGKHLNGEILLRPGGLEKCEQAFKELFGLHWINSDTKKPRMNADGTIRQKKGLRFAIDFPIESRRNQARLYGEFYSVFNWVSYGTKQFTRRWFARKYTKESVRGKESFCFISSDLNELSTQFYNENIKVSHCLLTPTS
ncbi:hypothetical protein [Methylobacter tundripaludum]|uniref:Uncharacterized protein n=1 Tax=Methylobacter tundripaludum (strain ATCC BAA-1195 / DSM 17260 / SV96) TaxID=697282 RepID=G3J0B0_METTV|nr:hypothetical protein [Methylobacter tundripaludum]EGW20632.1 hypothetical protein Mettu_3780 [Methylobacter tundripaludum SV96]